MNGTDLDLEGDIGVRALDDLHHGIVLVGHVINLLFEDAMVAHTCEINRWSGQSLNGKKVMTHPVIRG